MKDRLLILWLKTGPLHPLDTGGKLRTYHMARELARRHHITYLALCPPDTTAEIKSQASDYSAERIWLPWHEARKGSPRFFTELLGNAFSALPYTVQKYASADMAAAIARHAPAHDLIVCDFLTPAVNWLRAGPPATPALLFQHNVEALIWRRLADNATGVKKIYFESQWRRLWKFERDACARFRSVVGVSDEDCELMRREYSLANVAGSVPTGVDTDYFQPPSAPRTPRELVFLGSMDWMPNVDGIVWFAEEIWPVLKSRCPGVTLAIVGRRPTAKVRELAARDPAIRVTGTVPDVRPHLATATAMIVPLRVGGGTRIKIYEGMATGIPVVSTRIGAEGLAVRDGEHIALADAPADFADATARVLEEPATAERIGTGGLRLVREQFSWGKVTDVFERHCRAALAG
jgi:glycosyltransferase involved in cell wall biosynthesis